MKKLSLKKMLSLILAVCMMASLIGGTSLTAAAADHEWSEDFSTYAKDWSAFKTTYSGWSLSVTDEAMSNICNQNGGVYVRTSNAFSETISAGELRLDSKKNQPTEEVFVTKILDNAFTDNEIVFETRVNVNSNGGKRTTAFSVNSSSGTLARLDFLAGGKFAYSSGSNQVEITNAPQWQTGKYIPVRIVLSKSVPGVNNPYDTCYYYISDLNTPVVGGTNHMVNQTLTSVNNFSLILKPSGDYQVLVTYDYFKISGNKGSLAAPAKPVWGSSNKTLTWSAVENADSYDVYLIRDGEAVNTYNTASTSYDFSSVMASTGNGSYTAQVVAKSSTGYKDSGKSVVSDAYSFVDIPLTPLAKPSAPVWDTTNETIVNISAVDNSAGYELKLYKYDVEDDILITTVSTESLTYDFKNEMLKNGSGSYFVKVKALGNSLTYDDSEYSASSTLSVFDIEKYRKVNYVLDFEVPNFSLGDIAGQDNISHSSNIAPTNWTAKIVDEKTVKNVTSGTGTSRALELKSTLGSTVNPEGDVKIDFGSNFTNSIVSVSGRVYLSSAADRLKLTLRQGASSGLSQILFATGTLKYRAASTEPSFLNNNVLNVGWHDFEIRMIKDSASKYSSVKYFLDGTECLPQDANDAIWVKTGSYISGIWLQCQKTESMHTIFDDITVSSFDGESRPSASGVSNTQWDGKTLKWTPADSDNAVSYIARLYKNNEICSTVHVLPADVAGGADFSNELVYDQDITYTATVQAKGNYSTHISSAESTPLKYNFDVDVSEFRVYDSQGNSLKENFYGDSLTLKIEISEGKAINANMFLAYFNDTQLVSVGMKEINVTSDAAERTDSLVVPVPAEDVTHVKAFLFDRTSLKPLLNKPIVLTQNEDLVMPVLFSDNMVLQRDEDVAIWGKAPAGRTVTVEFGEQKKKCCC